MSAAATAGLGISTRFDGHTNGCFDGLNGHFDGRFDGRFDGCYDGHGGIALNNVNNLLNSLSGSPLGSSSSVLLSLRGQLPGA